MDDDPNTKATHNDATRTAPIRAANVRQLKSISRAMIPLPQRRRSPSEGLRSVPRHLKSGNHYQPTQSHKPKYRIAKGAALPMSGDISISNRIAKSDVEST